jgi:gamma-glutamyltranspeptidase/glutathione hydrolase
VLADTYTGVLEEAEAASSDRDAQIQAARDAFYRGFVAEAIGAFCAREVTDSSGRRHRGVLTADDLAAFEAPFEPSVSLDYEGWTVHKTGPWGQGPVLLQQLALLEGFDLEAMAVGSAEFVHTVIECSKLAFADREAWYGDPAFADVPLDQLLSEDYAAERRALVGAEASGELRPGLEGARLPKSVSDIVLLASGLGEPTRGDTCHLDVVDRFGNAVSATPSGGWLQSSPVVPELGFPLGTRAQMFWLEEGLPNSLEPRKRPRTTLSPSLAHRDGQVLSFGTPAATSRISGRSSSSSTTCTSSRTCRLRSTCRCSTRTTSRAPSTRDTRGRGTSRSRGASTPPSSTSSASAAMRSTSRRSGRSAG